MGNQRVNQRGPVHSRIAAACLVTAVAVLCTACDEPPPRSFTEFMDDRIAMEGTLARCSETSDDGIECANARRAQATIALREERERREALELESERKLAAMRDQMAWRERAEREAAAAAEAAAQAAYEAFWRENAPEGVDIESGASPVAGLRSPGTSSSGPPSADAPSGGSGLELIEVPTKVAPLAGSNEADSEEQSLPRPFRRR